MATLLPTDISLIGYAGNGYTIHVKNPEGVITPAAITARVMDDKSRLVEAPTAKRPTVTPTSEGVDIVFSPAATEAIGQPGVWLKVMYGGNAYGAGTLRFLTNADAVDSSVEQTLQIAVGEDVTLELKVVSVASAGGGFAPMLVADGESFTVGENQQVPFLMPLEVEGNLILDGYLIEL